MTRVLKLQTCGARVAAFCFSLSKWLVDVNIQHPCCAFFSYSDFLFCYILHVEPEWLIFHQFFSAAQHKDVLHLVFLELCWHWIVTDSWSWTSNGFMESPSNRNKQLFATSLIYKKLIKYFPLHFKYVTFSTVCQKSVSTILIMYTTDLS